MGEPVLASFDIHETKTEPVHRLGRGSLAGQLVMSGDWDCPPVNEEIAGEFESGRER